MQARVKSLRGIISIIIIEYGDARDRDHKQRHEQKRGDFQFAVAQAKHTNQQMRLHRKDYILSAVELEWETTPPI